ncbi:MAG: phenylalanine--tRNA ligase subunit alpha [bacterium]
MIEAIKELKQIIESKISSIVKSEDLENFRLEFLVKKGSIQTLFDKMREVPADIKPLVGKELNLLRNFAETQYSSMKERFTEEQEDKVDIDITLPGRKSFTGSIHPITQTVREMITIFERMGFVLAEGPDIEDGFHNFDALNFPPDHPARDMQDTFFIKDEREIVLRTHTSPVQIRVMQSQKPPIRSIMPGRVYRNESLDSTHLAEFYQIEGLYIDKNVNFAELKATMMVFARKMYGDNLKFRYRPSFFPFTEPSAELDIMKPGTEKWMEVAGCGMVHPDVLTACGIDPEVYSGFAFGFGIERVTMLKTGISDIRYLYENDIRVLEQF